MIVVSEDENIKKEENIDKGGGGGCILMTKGRRFSILILLV